MRERKAKTSRIATKMNLASTLLLIVASVGYVLAQSLNPKAPIHDPNPVSASAEIYETEISPYCVERTSGNPRPIWPSGSSVENLIALIERLELYVANDTDRSLRAHVGADNMAKLLLRRFRYDGYAMGGGVSQYERDDLMSTMASTILTAANAPALPPDYGFPNKFFTQSELCSLYSMLSHNVYDTARVPRINYSQGSVSPYVPTRAAPLKEEGVVSFRSHPTEAIQISRALIGIIAGLTGDAKNKARDVLRAIRQNATDLPAEYDKDFDPVTMVTLADLYGVAQRRHGDAMPYYYGLTGNWQTQSCTSYYGIQGISQDIFNRSMSSNYIQATKAEIRGGLDGYKIGKALQSMGTTDLARLKLSTILRSYYSKPQSSGSLASFTVSYCDRNSNLNIADIDNNANIYAAIVARAKGRILPPSLMGNEFKSALTAAQSSETGGFTDYCTKPSGQLDENAPCETPADVLYFIDGTDQKKLLDSANIVSQINGNLNGFRYEGGTVSVFFNSGQKSNPNPDVQMPPGTGQDQWPLTAAAFNSTNTGYAQCRIFDFNNTGSTPQAVANTGKYFRYLNATLMEYEWWTPRAKQSWVPAKSAVLIDYNSVADVPDNGSDRTDYNYYKEQLRRRHRDVLYLALSQKQDLFKSILRNSDTDWLSPDNAANQASTLARKICDNPATFQYNMCHDHASRDVQYTGFITPGYKQNWAMYPQFFVKSSNISFTFRAEEGNIRVCFDRSFPPRRQNWCIDSNENPNIQFDISDPCKGRSLDSCDPFYFSVWGKDKTNPSQCLDTRCQNLNQIRWTVTHTGVQCSSSNHLLPSIAFQLTSLTLFAILYLLLSH